MTRSATIRRLAASLTLGLALAGPALAEGSSYGCRGMAQGHFMASVEGRDGVFFRIDPDLHNHHPMAPETIADLATLTEALAARGTALIYAPVPVKSLAMPRALSPATRDYGFDYSLATTVQLDAMERLAAAGVRVADIRSAMVAADGPLPFFRTDPRLTAEGARIAATAIAAQISEVPGIEALAKSRFESVSTGNATVASHARQVRQRYCDEPLPTAETETFQTRRTYEAEGARGVVALVGSAHSDTPEANFAGFLAQESGLDVVQYSVPGGGAFAAISTYLTSAEFQAARPSVLVWELPQDAAPGLADDQPMAELIAAARGSCDIALPLEREADLPGTMRADLTALDAESDYMLFVDGDGAPARRLVLAYETAAGETRHREVLRHRAQLPTGRFYVPMTGLWPDGATSVTVTLDAELGDAPEVSACLR
ncbi:alginate O-acetyltransferase AlgX-related protein [Marinovum sp.]|uniref:alginate O-acetyltransferase AlgX-related protein n=1 Tax=Marinovum sp. TaxID=2024839 RepID=UPI003A913935